jgi:hypothetical protein
VIEIGYTTTSAEDTVIGSYDSPATANAAILELRDALASRQDIKTLFMQTDFGQGLKRYGFLDPERQL